MARNLGCVTRLSPGQSQLLGLRAGLTGEAPQSASAVARILHVTAGREARLEHDALTALSQTGRYGCPATPTTTVVFDTGFPLLITPNGPFGAASAPGPNHTVASAGAARAPRPTRAVESPRSGSLGVTRASHSAAYYGAGVDGPAVSPTSGSPGTNVLLNRLLLAAAALAAVVMVAWYAESRAYPLSTSQGRPRPSARALPGPHPWQPVRSRKGIRILPFTADGAGRRLRGLGAALLALRAHRRRAEPRRQAELPQAVSNGNAHAQKAVAELPPPPDRIVSGMESEDTELGLWRSEIVLYASERAVRGVDLSSAAEKAAQVDGEHGIFTDTEGRLWIRAVSLAAWLRRGSETDLKVKDVRARLAAMGWESTKLTARSRAQPGKVRSRNYWRSPAGLELFGRASRAKDTSSI